MTEHKEAISISERAKRKLERDMGPECLTALNDPKTVEIMLNADGKLWQERLGEPMKCIGSMRVAQAQAIIETVAGYHGKEVTRQKPILEGELPLAACRTCGKMARHNAQKVTQRDGRAVYGCKRAKIAQLLGNSARFSQSPTGP